MKTFIVTRPAALGELAASLDIPLDDLKDLVRRQRISPALWIGRVGFYGGSEIRRIVALAGAGQQAPVVAPTASAERWCG